MLKLVFDDRQIVIRKLKLCTVQFTMVFIKHKDFTGLKTAKALFRRSLNGLWVVGYNPYGAYS